jgi:hypothetical protein
MYATAFAIGISFVLIISADFLSAVLTANTSVHLGWFPLYCILLALILLIALADIRVSTRVQLVFAVIGVLTIVALSLAIVAHGGAQGLTWRPFDPGLAPSTHGLFLAVILAFTGFIGFEAAAVLGEEAAQPKRVIPRAILGTVIVATVYFVFVTWAQAVGYGVSGAGRWAADPTALATLSDRYVGHWFSTLVDIVVVVDSFVAALAGVHLTARTLFAMGRDGGVPRFFAAVTPRFCSPYVGIAVSVALTLVLGATLGRLRRDHLFRADGHDRVDRHPVRLRPGRDRGHGVLLAGPPRKRRVLQLVPRHRGAADRGGHLRVHDLRVDLPAPACADQLLAVDRPGPARGGPDHHRDAGRDPPGPGSHVRPGLRDHRRPLIPARRLPTARCGRHGRAVTFLTNQAACATALSAAASRPACSTKSCHNPGHLV